MIKIFPIIIVNPVIIRVAKIPVSMDFVNVFEEIPIILEEYHGVKNVFFKVNIIAPAIATP